MTVQLNIDQSDNSSCHVLIPKDLVSSLLIGGLKIWVPDKTLQEMLLDARHDRHNLTYYHVSGVFSHQEGQDRYSSTYHHVSW